MKINNLCSKPASIPKTRWASYAAAGAATALAGSQSVGAAIHYSGRLDVPFEGECGTAVQTFQLDQPGDSFRLTRNPYYCGYGVDYVNIFGIASAGVRGFGGNRYTGYVSKLSFGQRISRGPFVQNSYNKILVGKITSSFGAAQWTKNGLGFIGFSFNNGAGVQYGWARIRMTGYGRANVFKLFDYAYADPGEPLRAGQTSSDEQAPDQGSLGWLALGAVGLLAWRKSRSLTARLEDA
jgi:MYXO-CTERM domain-containing protein